MLKMAPASIGRSMAQRLGAVWRPKMAAKGASRAKENRIFTCEVALRRSGKDILRVKRFGLKKIQFEEPTAPRKSASGSSFCDSKRLQNAAMAITQCLLEPF